MMLFEIVNTKFDLSKIKSTKNKIVIKHNIGGRPIEFEAKLNKKTADSWHIEFFEVIDGERVSATTGSGSAGQVLSFVVECVKYMVEKVDPKEIVFSATHAAKSRAAVYERILKREFPQYHVTKNEIPSVATIFIIKKQ